MQVLDLGGSWRLMRVREGESIPAQVPGCVHTDLLAAGRIEEPFYRDNEERLQWISDAEWAYSRTFEATDALLQARRILLRCEGLDTLATIRLNGQEIARTDNMYRTWEFDVAGLLKSGQNTIEIHFASPVAYIRPRQVERPLPDWSGPREIKGRAYLRKEPCNFGWDWGPVFTTSGIWRPIKLVAFDTARLTDVRIHQNHSTPNVVKLDVEATAEVLSEMSLKARISVLYDGQVIAQDDAAVSHGGCRVQLTVQNPKLWWPAGMGEQPLYEVKVELLSERGSIDTLSKRIGLRTLRLDRHPDQWGESFQFTANGGPLFRQGRQLDPGRCIRHSRHAPGLRPVSWAMPRWPI